MDSIDPRLELDASLAAALIDAAREADTAVRQETSLFSAFSRRREGLAAEQGLAGDAAFRARGLKEKLKAALAENGIAEALHSLANRRAGARTAFASGGDSRAALEKRLLEVLDRLEEGRGTSLASPSVRENAFSFPSAANDGALAEIAHERVRDVKIALDRNTLERRRRGNVFHERNRLIEDAIRSLSRRKWCGGLLKVFGGVLPAVLGAVLGPALGGASAALAVARRAIDALGRSLESCLGIWMQRLAGKGFLEYANKNAPLAGSLRDSVAREKAAFARHAAGRRRLESLREKLEESG